MVIELASILIVIALDEGNISRDPYRHLYTIESYLPCERAVFKINEEKVQFISISIVNVNTKNQVDQSEEENIENKAIVQEVIDAIGKDDEYNVGRKVKHMMVVVLILDDKNTLHKPNHHHTIILYSGYENYDSLLNIITPYKMEFSTLIFI
ncbi:hypothetical protein C1646_756357 [Rhizophagus diaphanus]|nr:hypothetical protein C1646_756357 [Rhizophagus diaphanus] [Rhizophagus sp. MUCL 43196]